MEVVSAPGVGGAAAMRCAGSPLARSGRTSGQGRPRMRMALAGSTASRPTPGRADEHAPGLLMLRSSIGPKRQARGTDGTVALVDRGWQETGSVTALRTASVFAGFRFPPEVISLAVRWYLRYGLSYRDVEELLAERGIAVDHVTIYRWVQRFTPEFIEAARPCRHAPGDRWFADETYLKVAGKWTYLYRAVDQYGQVIDVLLSGRRDLAAARRCPLARRACSLAVISSPSSCSFSTTSSVDVISSASAASSGCRRSNSDSRTERSSSDSRRFPGRTSPSCRLADRGGRPSRKSRRCPLGRSWRRCSAYQHGLPAEGGSSQLRLGGRGRDSAGPPDLGACL